MVQLTTAIVIPCYNEAARLPVAAFKAYLDEHPEMHFFFVNDGSCDKTLETLLKLRAEYPRQARVLSYVDNQGKAEAVRTGMQEIFTAGDSVDIVGFWDADLATPLDELPKFLQLFLDNDKTEMVIGSRSDCGKGISRTKFRKAASACVAWLVHHLLKVPFPDTQCGAKLFRRGLAQNIFSAPFHSKWLFDVEIFKRIQNQSGRPLESCVAVHPLAHWTDVPGSKLTALQSCGILAELATLCLTNN